MDIAFLCVNYNSYFELNNYIASISEANANPVLATSLNVNVFIADNSIFKEDIINLLKFDNIKIELISNKENLGYLGGIDSIILKYPEYYFSKFDYVIISNVDIILPIDFFENLSKVSLFNDLGCIAPSILSLKEKKDRNPKLINRYSVNKLKLLAFIYSHPLINYFYITLFYKRKKHALSYVENTKIYAGHGSFMIFTRLFFGKIDRFHYESFLFGEEIYIGELMKLLDLKVVYIPSIIVKDIDHVSTSCINGKIYCKWNRDSIKYIIKKFY